MMPPMPPKAAPGAADESAGAASSADPKAAAVAAHDALMKFGSALQKAGVSPDALDALKSVIAQFQDVADDALSGGAEPKAAPSGPVPIEAGANKGAMPMMG